ncbi:protein STIP1 homolog isoform X4 [Homarus americanus]|uniref:protein STIP1 homolog isoform X4 n=1 Tax=Homarus americanus TaxID=6706 RepID=UPI001C493B05|nr:protein STIP1 homolog isoform X4 [Homarus americanus]XP_042209189.1 protein STIP1 homolog isoform X4 [Homarus americanus]
MGISDKEAFRILGLPLGVDKDAINDRYKSMSSKLSSSKSLDDKKKLEQVVAAYSQLLPPSTHKIQQSKQNNRASHGKSQPVVYEDDDDSDDDSSEDEWRVLCRNGDARNHITKTNNVDLTDAEKEKRKAEKRRAKKKRRKEKKKLGKLENQILNQNSNNSNSKREDDSGSEEDDEDEEEEVQGLDPNSAFVATAAGKKIGLGATSKHEDRRKALSKGASQEEDDSNAASVDTVVLQSRQLAIRGNEAANVGQYSVAVRLFTDAIRLDPNDHRFFGNRSYCYDQLGQHEKALKDAEKAIKIAPQWPKGHFRKGTSLRGLGKYIDAESAFEVVLRLDKGCQEAQEEIRKVRIVRIVEMGFTERQANNAIAKYNHVQPALDALLAGEFKESLEDVFYSDEEEDFLKHAKISQGSKDVKMKTYSAYDDTPLTRNRHVSHVSPRNPEGLTSLWVGNVLPEVTEKMLSQLFSKQGHVTSVRLLKEKYCAFVNYADKGAAGRAMETLQGYEFCGQKLLIKFPDNPILSSAQNVIIRKSKPQSVKKM